MSAHVREKNYYAILSKLNEYVRKVTRVSV